MASSSKQEAVNALRDMVGESRPAPVGERTRSREPHQPEPQRPRQRGLPLPLMLVDPVNPSATEALNALRMQLGAGVALGKSLHTSAKLCKNLPARSAFNKAAQVIDAGASFDEMLLALCPVLSLPERAILSAGWAAGRFDPAISSVIKRREVMYRTRQEVRSQMLLPSIILLAASFIAPFPAYFLGQITWEGYLFRALTPIAIGLGIFLGIRGFQFWTTRRHAGRELDAPPPPITPLDYVTLAVPMLALVQRWRNRAEFASLMANLQGAGVNTIAALEVCARALPNGLYRGDVQRCVRRVREEGVPIVEGLPHGQRWPGEWLAALEVAHQTGEEEKVFSRLAEDARDRYLRAVKMAGVAAARLAYLAVSLFVLFQILGLLSAIGGLYSSVLG